MSLNWINQDDFAAGILRNVARDTEVGVGVSNAVNGLFDDDGDCYLRGNTVQYVAPVGSPLTFLWTGELGGAVGLVSTATTLYSLQANVLTALVGGTPVTRPVKPAIVKGELFLPNGTSWKGVGTQPQSGQLPAPLPGMVGSVHLAAAGGRLVVGQGRFVYFSAAGNPHLFDPTDFHELPEGAQIRGLATIKNTLLVFTGYGIWAIENLELDLTDDAGNPQQVMQKLIPELGLLHESGLAEWAGRIVAPCDSRLMLIDTLSAPTPISDSIPPLYMAQIFAGNLPGGAKVYRNHLFLPWLTPAGAPVTTHVCRLNRPVKARATYYPFSIFTGHAGGMVMGDIASVTNTSTMLVAHVDGRILDYQGIFDADAPSAHDADGSTPEFDLETRDFPTGNGQPNHLRGLRLAYTLQSLDGESASVDAAFSYGSLAQNYEQLRTKGLYSDVKAIYPDYGAARRGELDPTVWGPNPWADDPGRYWVAIEGRASESDGVEPEQWLLPRPKRVRYARVRFRCVDPVAKLVVHRVGLGVRPATHQR